MSKGTKNAQRVRRAAAALKQYKEKLGDPYADKETVVVDLFTDVMHYCGKHGIGWYEAFCTAAQHFRVEVERAP